MKKNNLPPLFFILKNRGILEEDTHAYEKVVGSLLFTHSRIAGITKSIIAKFRA